MMLYEQVEKREKEACGGGVTTVTGAPLSYNLFIAAMISAAFFVPTPLISTKTVAMSEGLILGSAAAFC